MVMYCLVRRDRTRRLAYDALCCSERYPPTVEEAGFRFEAAAPEPAASYEGAPDEHARLVASAATSRLGFGDKVRLIPATATRPSPSTTGMSVCAAIASSRSRRITARVWRIDFRRRPPTSEGEPTWCGRSPLISRDEGSLPRRAASSSPACRGPSLPDRPAQ
jgi:hypothetical protein